MRNIKISKWFSLFLFMLTASVNSAFSQTLSIADFYIEGGATKKVTIDLVQGDTPVLAFQADIVLPEGLTVQGKPKAVAETLTDEFGDPATPTVTYSNGKIVVYNSDGLTFNSDATAIVTLNLTAAQDFAGGTITLENIVISGEDHT